MTGSVRVLGICGSPRGYGQARLLLELALEAARSEGAEVELVDLYDYRIEPCLGCVSDSEKACRYPCIISDSMRELYDKVLAADALILSTPVYWYAPPGHVKNFVDRLTALENMVEIEGRSWVEGKVAGVIAVGNDSGALHAAATLTVTLVTMGFAIPPWGIAVYAGPRPVWENHGRLLDAANVGRQVVLLARAVKREGLREWYDPSLLERLAAVVERIVETYPKRREERLAVLPKYS